MARFITQHFNENVIWYLSARILIKNDKRNNFFPDFKVNDTISLCGKFSSFLKPEIFRDTQISKPYSIKG